MSIRPKTQDGCIPKQRPSFVIDAETGEVLEEDFVNKTYVLPFLEYVRRKTKETIALDKEQIFKVIEEETKVKQPTGLAWKHGIRPELGDGKKLGVLALSRVEKVIQHRIVSEVSSYINNPNPKKEAPTYDALKANLGAADKQMCSVEYNHELDKVFVTWKCWLRELVFVFNIPRFAKGYDVVKYCLPSLAYYEESKEVKYDLPFVERLDYSDNEFHHCYGAYDDGRVLPYALVFKNHKGAVIAEYAPSGRCCQLNAKRERLLANIKDIQVKLARYDALGIPEGNQKRLRLIEEKRRLKAKAKRQGVALAQMIGYEIGRLCRFHGAAVCAAENLSWVNAAHGSSRWNHSAHQSWVERECHRSGVVFMTVSPKNSSNTCSACGSADVTHNGTKRLVTCKDCGCSMNRDFSAARILCDRCKKSYRKYIGKIVVSRMRC